MRCDYQLEVTFYSYHNPYHKLAAANRCCDNENLPCLREKDFCDSIFTFCQRPIGGARLNIADYADQSNIRIVCNDHNVAETLTQSNTDSANFSKVVFGLENPVILRGKSWVR